MKVCVSIGMVLALSVFFLPASARDLTLAPATDSGRGAGGVELRVPEGFLAVRDTVPEAYTNTGWAKEIVHEKTGIEMVFVPAGEFMMGSPSSEEGRDDSEGPVHRVLITKPFYLGKYEVTQGQWQGVMVSNLSQHKGDDRLPVEMVSWGECQDFLKRAGHGLRLPTEAEWEYACRAGTTTRFCFGDSIAADDVNYDRYGFMLKAGRRPKISRPASSPPKGGAAKKDYRPRSTLVGSLPPNGWGLHDMHGNVCEWCQDCWDPQYYERSPESDPVATGSGDLRIVRGGSHLSGAEGCRSATRQRGGGGRTPAIGFRACLGLP